MASADIVIRTSEYRPCVVGKRKGWFHCWEHKASVVGESFLRGGHSAGQISMTLGIVEFEDGTIEECAPYRIRFTDAARPELLFKCSRCGWEFESHDQSANCPKCHSNTCKVVKNED